MPTFSSDDVAQLHVPRDMEWAGFAQGTLLAWNPNTFENQIEVRGGRLTNRPVAATAEALTYQPGDVLMLTRWKPRSGRGIATYWIGTGGKVIFPGTGAAEQAVAFLRGGLAQSLIDDIVTNLIGSPAGSTLIRGLIGEAIHTDSVEPQQTTSSTNFTDLSTVGPQVTAPISATGRALVEFGCVFTTDTTNDHVSMSFEVSGATSQPPSGFRSVQLQFASAVIQSTSMAVMVDGLAEGDNTFTAKYKVTTVGATGFFGNRWMIVTPY